MMKISLKTSKGQEFSFVVGLSHFFISKLESNSDTFMSTRENKKIKYHSKKLWVPNILLLTQIDFF